MITGVVAQFPPLPAGLFLPRGFSDLEQFERVFSARVGSGLDQEIFPDEVVAADDEIFEGADLPLVLTPDFVDPWFGEELIFFPFIRQDQRIVHVTVFTSSDLFLRPDIRIPGFLQPTFLPNDDVIHPTPLILDRGMLRAELFVDPDASFSPTIAAPDMLRPGLYTEPDDEFFPPLRFTGIGPPLKLNDDGIFAFESTVSGYGAPFHVDDARPITPIAVLDGISANVTLSSDLLTAVHHNTLNYGGARSTMARKTGKMYFEVTVHELHGARDAMGIVIPGTSYTQFTQFTNCVALYANYPVQGPGGQISRATVITNNAWYTTFGSVVPDDIVSIAVNLTDHIIWFRKNGGPWNNGYYGLTPTPGQNPATNSGGFPIVFNDAFVPACILGGLAGNSATGQLGDSMTFNCGQYPFAYAMPSGYEPWAVPSPFPPTLTGDRFGHFMIGIPTVFSVAEGGSSAVSIAGDGLTVTHDNTIEGFAYSTAWQNWGKFYFEVTVGATHALEDTIGITQDGFNEGEFVSGIGSTVVFCKTGDISANYTTTTRSLGRALVPGDVIGVAVDLTIQTKVHGGYTWFRLNGGTWNNTPDSDPVLGEVGLGISNAGFNHIWMWAPAVGFGGGPTLPNDFYVANFGQTPFHTPAPLGFAIWPNKSLGFVQTLQHPFAPVRDDVIEFPFVDQEFRVLSHPDMVYDDLAEIFEPIKIVGGSLFMVPQTVVQAPDDIKPAGFYANLGGVETANVLVSADRRIVVRTASGGGVLGARSVNWRSSGKYYFEVTAGQISNTNNGLGVMTSGGDYPNATSNTTNCSLIKGNGSMYSNNSFGAFGSGNIAPGETIGVAVDMTGRRIWFGRGSVWNNSGSANPAVSTGGLTLNPGLIAPIVMFEGGIAGDQWTCNFGSETFVGAPPSGFFGGWPGGSQAQPTIAGRVDDNVIPTEEIYAATLTGGITVLASFNGTNTNVGMTNGNLTATHVNTTSNSGARSTSQKTTGKYYFEVAMTTVSGAFDCAGILTSAGTYTNLVTNGTNCLVAYKSTGNVHSNNIASGKTLGAIANGDMISVCVDLTARKGWIRKNGGLWNGKSLSLQNPATGLGGVPLAATVSFAPAIGFGGTGTAVGDAMTANFGLPSTPFAYAAPAGFGVWAF